MDEDRLRFFEVNEEMSKMWTFRKLREIIKTDQKESKDVKEKNDKENSQSIDNGLIEYRSMSEKKSVLDASHLTLINSVQNVLHIENQVHISIPKVTT
ncbi:unnamed protein product [Rhizophagus irregularis]|nr:unnamed protein product [Rhizophagus irregularis]